MHRGSHTLKALTGLALGCAAVVISGCASTDMPDGTGRSPSHTAAAKPNHRQYFDQNRGRYYYFDQTAHRYYWEDGTPRN
jgi:hypothetical protein